ncbi:TadE/TadG family type IV pilus assembly protein [Paenibacillus sp. A14]|uniref:TadE/TadG family type IV pilus assembly protein n=1 Tax=Paenibacillus sp. A14 TaxID=3119820 RepID=UPI002FE17F7B
MQSREGSFTLEASLVLPVILTTLLILLFFCMFLYQRAVLGQVAAVAAERNAYVWDNSYRKPETGAFEEGSYDPLYWRLSDDGMLQAIFGFDRQNPGALLSLPAVGEDGGDALPLRKLNRVGQKVHPGIQGEMTYDNRLLMRKAAVSLNRFAPLAPLERVIGDITQDASSEAYIVDPVEWIRSVNLAGYYGAKFKGSGGSSMDKQEAGKALALFGK